MLNEELSRKSGAPGGRHISGCIQASLQYLYPNSKFAERDVIGDLEVIENFEYDALTGFLSQMVQDRSAGHSHGR